MKLTEKEFSSFAPAEQAEMFLKSNDSDRINMVEMSENPRALLENVPAAEIWWTIKRLNPDDSIVLIKYATSEQLQVICDIEWWRRDRMDTKSFFEWMNYIVVCGTNKIVEWFKEGDWDQILLFFKQNIVVFKKEDKDTDPGNAITWPRDEMPITYEGVYYFQVLSQKRDELVRYFLEILAKHELDLYHSICEACLWDVPSQREEEAYDSRIRRLAEHGFPSFDEAIAIYAPISADRFKSVAQKRNDSNILCGVPRYPLAVMGDQVLFINRVFSRLDEEKQNAFLLETAGISNKVLIADGGELNEEGMKSAIVKTIGYTNIGLETLSGGDLEKAANYLSDFFTHSIFQAGLYCVLKLSDTVKDFFKKGWMGGDKMLFDLLDDVLRIRLRAVLSKRPKFYDGGNVYSENSIRDFLSVAEIDLVKETVKKARIQGDAVFSLFVGKNPVFEMIDDPAHLKLSCIMSTAAANWLLEKGFVLGPIDEAGIEKVAKRIDRNRKTVIFDIKKAFFAYIKQRGMKLSADEEAELESFVLSCLNDMQGELNNLEGKIDKRYIQSVWVI